MPQLLIGQFHRSPSSQGLCRNRLNAGCLELCERRLENIGNPAEMLHRLASLRRPQTWSKVQRQPVQASFVRRHKTRSGFGHQHLRVQLPECIRENCCQGETAHRFVKIEHSRMSRLRISAISYLNTAPLMWDFEHDKVGRKFEISYTLPSQCAAALSEGSADIGIIPAAAYASIPDLAIVPGVAIAS